MRVLLFIFLLFNTIYAKEIKQNGKTFFISDSTYEQLKVSHPGFIKLVLATESMDDDERQYWFDVFPSMTDIMPLNIKT